jgi:two-component system sensor histidine kinase DesK
VLASLTDGQPANWELAGALIGLSFWMCAFMGNIRLTRELEITRQELAVAAVTAERERIGRDLHDILGHSLTAIAVKAGLARRLIEQGSRGAVDEVADVERLAREALADVRATASGYREVSLGSELAVAATVLRAAGITAHLPGAVDAVDPAAREVLGYVTREAVTNVVRHSAATCCTITVGSHWLEVVDDGRLPTGGRPGAGSGLPGLRQRVQQAGGVLETGPLPGGGFRVRAALAEPAKLPPAASSVPAGSGA